MSAEEMRTNATICLALEAKAAIESERLRYHRMAVGWKELAINQDWLDGVVHYCPHVGLNRAA